MLGSRRARRAGSGTTLIAEGTIIVGDVRFTGCLEVEGLVRGNIIGEDLDSAVVRVVGNGCVEGEIRAPRIVINGSVIGNVYCSSQLELASLARVTGDVQYVKVEMSAGAEVNGSLTHVTEDRGAVSLEDEAGDNKKDDDDKG